MNGGLAMGRDGLEKAVDLIKNSKNVVVLTGAGVSTESGIPDFRSPGMGFWEKIDPMQALSTSVLLNNPERFYQVGFKILTSMQKAETNVSHRVLAALEAQGHISTIITQNIDGLHQKAGSKKVLEVHGHIRNGYCMQCGEVMTLENMIIKVELKEIPPKCSSCNGDVRPSVVLFGDQLPQIFDVAWNEAEKSDLLIVIGSSLEVGPVNYLAQICEKLMIINMSPTAYDHRAILTLNGKASEILWGIYELL